MIGLTFGGSRRSIGLPAVATMAALLVLGAPRAQGQCEPQWLPGEGLPGLSDPASAAVVYDDGSGPALYVGGGFAGADFDDSGCVDLSDLADLLGEYGCGT